MRVPSQAHLTVRWGNATVVATMVPLDADAAFLDGAVRIAPTSDGAATLTIVPLPGAVEVSAPIQPGRRQRVFAGPFTVVIDAEADEPATLGRRAIASARAVVADAASFMLHAVVIGLLAFFADPMAPREPVDLSLLLAATAEPRPDRDEPDLSGAGGVVEGANVTSAEAEGASGSDRDPIADRGAPVRRPRGAERVPASHRTDDDVLAEVARFGVVSLVRTADARVPSPWEGADELVSAGGDAGMAWGNTLGEGLGYGGLGLLGIGEGAGGKGAGVAWGTSGGGLGSAGATCDDLGCRGALLGHGLGRDPSLNARGGHHVRTPNIRCPGEDVAGEPAFDTRDAEGQRIARGDCSASVSGRLPPEVIQRVVRQNFGRMRACYETQTDTQGRVTVRFVIGRDGAVGGVQASAQGVRETLAACVGRAFSALTFPAPTGGVVTVSYPIVFTPE